MFSSNPSASHTLISFINHENDGVYFNHHDDNSNPFLSDDCVFHTYNSIDSLSSPVHPITDFNPSNAPDFVKNQDPVHDDYVDDLLESIVYSSNKKTVTNKKDGHSKIITAQGPRDRRVRLSIDISKKFFFLQDMLGYDRASKTIDWLFTKSKKAIKQLVEETKHSSSSTVRADECELAFFGTIEGGSDGEFKFLDGRSKKMIQKNKYGLHVNISRDQLRAEARSRARERTKEKLRIKDLDKKLKRFDDDSYICGQTELRSDYNDIVYESTLEQQRFSVSSSMLNCYDHHNLVLSDNSSSQIAYKDL